jgi:hypothetical protein
MKDAHRREFTPTGKQKMLERLSALRSIGHKLSIELAEFDLAAIGVVLRSLETVLEGFEKW